MLDSELNDRDFLRCVDLGLDAFGSNMRQATYSALRRDGEDKFSTDILRDPDALRDALKVVFGAGYLFAERSIVMELKRKFDLEAPASSYTIGEAFRIVSREIRKSARGT